METKEEKIKAKSSHLRGTLNESLENEITGSLHPDDQNVIKFHGMYQQDDRDRREERLNKKLEPLYSYMLRLRIAGGKISAKQWLSADKLANDEHASSTIKITTRQTLQLHGIAKTNLKPTLSWFDKHNLDSIAACGDVNRNVMCSVSIAESKAYDEVYAISKNISDSLLPKTNAYHEIWLDKEKISLENETEPMYGKTYLPRKFKIAMAIPPYNDVDVFAHDVGLIAIIEKGELKGFNLSIGGGMGSTHGNKDTYPRLGDILGYISKEDTIKACTQILILQRDNGNRENRKLSRLKYTVARLGVDWFKKEISKKVQLQKAKKIQFSNRADEYGWREDYKGNYHYTQFVENGRVLDDEKAKLKTALFQIAKLNYANFRFTNNQNIIISDVDKSNQKKIDEILKKNLVSNNNLAPIRQNAIACVAFNTCTLAVAEAQRYLPSLIVKIEDLLKKHKLQKEPISIRMTGCPNGCARVYLSEIGLVGKAYGEYNMRLGGDRFGERLNSPYKDSLNEEAILKELDKLFGKYNKNKKTNETFGDFSNRSVI